jgi:hypothetical protein
MIDDLGICVFDEIMKCVGVSTIHRMEDGRQRK